MRAQFITLFLIPLIIIQIVTPWVITIANKIGAVDKPNERKVHDKNITRLGGLAIFLSISVSVLIGFILFPDLFEEINNYTVQTAIFVGCFVAIFALGFLDDVHSLRTSIKFGVQFLIAILIYFAGFKISNITNPLGVGVLSVEIIDFPLTIFWIVGVINAFNLIDGLDGLASGVAIIACLSIFIVSTYSGFILSAMLSIIIVGAMLGFLRFNFFPAKIFMGDSGSLLIGFCLAILSIQSTTKISTGFALLFPLLVLALPITDTLVSMSRRFLGSYLKKDVSTGSTSLFSRIYGMFTPDKSHIHHQLLSLGLSHRNAVILLYFVSGFFAVGAFVYTQIQSAEMFFNISVIFAAALFVGIKKLGYHEIAIFNNGLIMSLYEKWILNRFFVTQLADLVFTATAYTLSYSLINSLNPEAFGSTDFTHTLVTVLTVQIVTFWVSGLYQEKIDQFSVGNVLQITSSVGYSVLAAALTLSLTNSISIFVLGQLLVFNFYFLITFILGFRVAYQIFIFLFNRNKKTGENILIYGANENGKMVLHKLIHSPDNSVRVLGFLEDDPEMEGKMVHGYPILGGHWKLTNTDLCEKVHSVYVCEEKIKKEDLRRLKKTAFQKNIMLKKLQVNLLEIENTQSVEEEKILEVPKVTVTT